MKSTIKIDFETADGTGSVFSPVIKVKIENSDDPRDGLIKAFFEQLGYNSNWLKVQFDQDKDDTSIKNISIRPVQPQYLANEMIAMDTMSKEYGERIDAIK